MNKLVTISAMVVMAAAAMPSFAGMTVYTNEAAFTAMLQPGYYLKGSSRNSCNFTDHFVHRIVLAL